MPDDKRDQNTIDKNMQLLPNLYNILDNALAQSKYLAGNEFTLADLNVASVAGLANALGFDVIAYPNVGNWMKAVSDRPSFQKYTKLRS